MTRGRGMERRATTIAASLAILAMGVGGCDGEASSASQKPTPNTVYRPSNAPREELSREQIADHIFIAARSPRRTPCPLAVARAGDIHTADSTVLKQGEDLDAWFERTVRTNRQQYPLSEVHHEGDGWTGVGWKSLAETYEYREGIRDMHLKSFKTWGSARRNVNNILGDYPYKQVEVSFCAFVPDHVEVLSTSGSSTSGWIGVQYQLAWAPTAILRTFIGADLRGLHLPDQPLQSGSATLQRTSAGLWDVQLQ